MSHVLEFVYSVRQAVMFYASTAMKPFLRDRVLKVCFPPQTATTMLMSTTVLALQTKMETNKYQNDPRSCRHPSGLRGYGAGGEKLSICDLCGARWMRGTGNDPGFIVCQPKASPTAKTPLFPKGSDMDKIVSSRRADRLNARSSSGSSPPSWPPHASNTAAREVNQSVMSSRPKSKPAVKSPGTPTILPTPSPARNTRLAGLSEQEIINMQHASRVAAAAEATSSTTRPEQHGCGVRALGLGRSGSQCVVRQGHRLSPGLRGTTSSGGGGPTGGGVLSDGFSADNPMMKEDRGSFKLKAGTQKRLSGNCRHLHEALQWEARVYQGSVVRSRTMRRYKNDLVEVFAGMGNITAEALSRQLRAIQPIDAVHGVCLDTKEDFKKLTQLLVERCPFLVVWEIRCDPWSNIQHLNYTAEELATIRESQYESIKGMCDSIAFLKTHHEVHFLLENPWGTPFWKHPEIAKLMRLVPATINMRNVLVGMLSGLRSIPNSLPSQSSMVW